MPRTPRTPKKAAPKKQKTSSIPVVVNPYAELDKQKVSATFQLFREAWFNSQRNLDKEGLDKLLNKFGESTTWVYVCVRAIASAMAQIPLTLQREVNGRHENVRIHDRGLNSLVMEPNPWQSWSDFMEAASVSLELTGNAFIELVPDKTAANRPVEMYILNPSRMTIIPDPVKYIAGFVYSANGKSVTFPPEDIIHIRFHHPNNDYYGLSPLTAARVAIDVDQAANEWNETFLLRGAWPAGAIETEHDLEPQELTRLQREIKRTMQAGKDQAGRILLLSGGLKYNMLGITPKDADWIGARHMSRDEILAIFGVPFAVAGLFSTEQTTARSAGVEQQIKQFYRNTIFAKVRKVVDALNRELAPRFRDGVFLVPNYRSIPALQEEVDQELTRAMALKTLVAAGVSLNKALDRLYPEMDSEPWGDAAWLPTALRPVTSAAEETPQNTVTNGKAPTAELDFFGEDHPAWQRVLARQREIES
jgi:HK97 family phage portal protein